MTWEDAEESITGCELPCTSSQRFRGPTWQVVIVAHHGDSTDFFNKKINHDACWVTLRQRTIRASEQGGLGLNRTSALRQIEFVDQVL
jgi:hypothetical protein